MSLQEIVDKDQRLRVLRILAEDRGHSRARWKTA